MTLFFFLNPTQVNCEKGPSTDKKGFADLITELRSAFVSRGLLLSAAVSASKQVIDAGKLFDILNNVYKLIYKQTNDIEYILQDTTFLFWVNSWIG